MGNLLAAAVLPANVSDKKAGIYPAFLSCCKYPTIEKFCGSIRTATK